jgi:hypothetical protein
MLKIKLIKCSAENIKENKKTIVFFFFARESEIINIISQEA